MIQGNWRPAEHEMLVPSLTTKLCAFAAAVITVVGYTNDFAYICIVGLFITVKLSAIFGEPVDPFRPLESAVFNVVAAIADSRGHVHKD